MFVLKKQFNFYSLCLNNKRREKRPWLSVPWRKKWAFHLLSPTHPMSSCLDSVLERLAFSWDRLIFSLYEWIKKPRTQTKHPPQKTTGISKYRLYHNINALESCVCQLPSISTVCSLLFIFLIIFLLYQYYDNLFKQFILNDLIFKLLSIYCSYWRKSG